MTSFPTFGAVTNRLFKLPLLAVVAAGMLAFNAFGQSARLDSLAAAASTGADSSRVSALTELCLTLRSTDPDRAVEYGLEGCELAQAAGLKGHEAMCRQTLANALIVRGSLSEATRQLRMAIELNKELGNSQREAACLSNLAIIHLNLGDLNKALVHHTEALRLRELLNDTVGIANSLNNLGVLHTELGSHAQALEYYSASLALKRQLGLSGRIAVSLNNIAISHRELGDTLRSLDLFEQSLSAYRDASDLSGEAMVLGNLGILKGQLDRGSDALDHFTEALRIERQLGNSEGLAIAYLNLSEWHLRKGSANQALNYADSALVHANELRALKMRRDAHLRMSDAFENMGDKARAFDNLKIFRMLNDSLHIEEAAKQVAELQARMETERIGQELNLLKAENELTLQRMVFEKRVSRITMALLVVALMLIALAVYAYRRSQRDNRLLAEKNTIIGQKNTDILNSINYAKRIQKAVLSSEAVLQQLFPSSALVFRPKDIVSGDFFWAAERNGKRFIAVADCTGHGVPGAFVSILGHTELTKALREMEQPRPHLLLQRLDERISDILRNEESSEVSDGMDIALCAFEPSTGQLDFCGAGRPLMVVCNREHLSEIAKVTAGEGLFLHLFTGSRRPVGKTHRDMPFDLLSLHLEPGDRVFISSDGFADQFGGPKDKKLGNRAFHELLLSTSVLPMAEQQKDLDDNLIRWMGATPQTDDICVVGFHA